MNYFLDVTGFVSKESKSHLAKGSNNVFKELNSYIQTVNTITSASQYNNIIKKLVFIVNNKIFTSEKSPMYNKEIIPISKSEPLTERTPWGGVAPKEVHVDKNHIKKLLVIAKHGVLGLEIHKLKHEKLKILEGICIVLYSNHSRHDWKPGKISVKIAFPGYKFEFLPNDEHGIIAITDCVIEEKSTNHLDDLVYIFKASQVI